MTRGQATTGLHLERLERCHLPDLLEMAEEFRAEGEAPWQPLLEEGAEPFFASLARFADGRDLPEDRVQQTQFLLYDGPELLAAARLRHRLIPILHRDGGNIGYEVRPAARGRGFGTALLALMLDEARTIGLERVLITAARDNDRSIRVIERNGGLPDGTAISHNSGKVMCRYWIALREERP